MELQDILQVFGACSSWLSVRKFVGDLAFKPCGILMYDMMCMWDSFL